VNVIRTGKRKRVEEKVKTQTKQTHNDTPTVHSLGLVLFLVKCLVLSAHGFRQKCDEIDSLYRFQVAEVVSGVPSGPHKVTTPRLVVFLLQVTVLTSKVTS